MNYFNKNLVFFLTNFLIISVLISCKPNNKTDNIDLSSIPLNLKIVRMDSLLWESKDINSILEVRKNHQEMYDLYMDGILADFTGGQMADSLEKARQFMLLKTNEDMDSLYKICQEKYGDFRSYQGQLTNAFKRFKYYFPSNKVPEIMLNVAPFMVAHAFTEDFVSIETDFYLGKDFKYYKTVPHFYDYMIQKFEKEYLVPNTIRAWLTSEFENTNDYKKFIDLMIYEGKMVAIMHRLLPEYKEHYLLSLTQDQLKWCDANEKEIWKHFIEENLLFEDDDKLFIRYFEEAPYTIAKGVPQESSPKIGVYAGWKMVEKYLNAKDISLDELIKTPAPEILKESGYKG